MARASAEWSALAWATETIMVPSTISDTTRRIALLNDAFRTTFLGGTVCVTAGLHLVGDEFVKAALLAVRQFDAFDGDNDPHEEHDFGALTVENCKLFFKIDYFDPTMTIGADNPADKENTRRVLTVMLAEEY